MGKQRENGCATRRSWTVAFGTMESARLFRIWAIIKEWIARETRNGVSVNKRMVACGRTSSVLPLRARTRTKRARRSAIALKDVHGSKKKEARRSYAMLLQLMKNAKRRKRIGIVMRVVSGKGKTKYV